MNTPHPVHWLSEQTRTGLRDLPSNAAWLLSRALQPAETAGSAATTAAADTRDTARKVKASVVDAAPVGGDSVETRMHRAQAAAERAREAEDRAVEAARQAKGRSEHAREVAERSRAHVAAVKRDAKQSADQRIAEARRLADEAVERESAAARAEADEQVRRAQAEAHDEAQSAQQDAEDAQRHAKELLAEANERLRTARQLADEATQSAGLSPRRPGGRPISWSRTPSSRRGGPIPGSPPPSRCAKTRRTVHEPRRGRSRPTRSTATSSRTPRPS